MSDEGYDPLESLGREHNEIVRLKARIAELEEALRSALACGGHTDDCSKHGDRGSIENDCDCWRVDAHLVLEKEER